ncbi:uncharacterized protein LOC125178700 [Hyalella azteca]|uniref:Uncharacterized protein LOC125178700 n=1 Tax=Hyalella azteca TaxID=294128 RepID=A0A979FPM4_HYAAZ|nr:uncharacterized protein LOC125178700 [Hyalella azteca]
MGYGTATIVALVTYISLAAFWEASVVTLAAWVISAVSGLPVVLRLASYGLAIFAITLIWSFLARGEARRKWSRQVLHAITVEEGRDLKENFQKMRSIMREQLEAFIGAAKNERDVIIEDEAAFASLLLNALNYYDQISRHRSQPAITNSTSLHE